MFCRRDLLDPKLDSPNHAGRYLRYHYRCWRKDKTKRDRATRAALKAWSVEPTRSLGAHRKAGGRRVFIKEGPYHWRQECACGASYIGGAAAVRCPDCQLQRKRELRLQSFLRNREKEMRYHKEWMARHPGRHAEYQRRERASLRRAVLEVQNRIRGRDCGRDEPSAAGLSRGRQLDAAGARKAS